MTSVEKGVLAAAAKKPAMPTMTKLAGMRHQAGPQLVQQHAQGAAAAAADHHRRAEDAARAAAADRQSRRDESCPRQSASRINAAAPASCVNRILNRRIAERQHGQHLLRFAGQKVAGKAVQQNRHQPGQQGPDGRPEVRQDGQPMEQPLAAVERVRVKHGQHDHEQRQAADRAPVATDW